MIILSEFPQRIQEYLLKSFGDIISIKKLNGIKSNGGCFRFIFSDTSVIVKQMIEPQEYFFYTECTKYIKKFKSHIPTVYWSYTEESFSWIVIEDIQNPLPRDRWHADNDLLEVLFYFHSEMWSKKLPLKNHYIPKWENELTYSALELVPGKISNKLQPLLFEIQKQSQRLFNPCCWINADTNPTNWGIRKDGTVVLFDWERISCGSPAIDLAITIPGLGTPDNSIESLISKRYLAMWTKLSNNFPFTEQKLIEDIKIANLWSVIEFLGNNWATLEHENLNNLLTKLIEKTYELTEILTTI